jgi:hypothetical protein
VYVVAAALYQPGQGTTVLTSCTPARRAVAVAAAQAASVALCAACAATPHGPLGATAGSGCLLSGWRCYWLSLFVVQQEGSVVMLVSSPATF